MEDCSFDIYVGKKLKKRNVQGPVIIKTDTNSLIGIQDLKRAGKPAFYRGVI